MEGRAESLTLPNCESMIYSLSYSFDVIQGITVEASSIDAHVSDPQGRGRAADTVR